MKVQQSKKIVLALGLLAVLFAAPFAPVRAQENTQSASSCASVDMASAQINRGLSERDAKYEDAKTVRLMTIEKGRGASDQKLADARAKADTAYQTQFDALAASVTSDNEIAAVTAFEKAMQSAV